MQGRRGENGVGPLGRPWTFRFRSKSLKVLVRLSSNFTHNTSRGSSCAFWGIWTLTYFWLRTMTYLDVLTHTPFRSRSRKVLGRLQSHCTYMFSKVPSCAFSGFWTLTLKLTQHFDLIYNIGKSDWNILRNIMKTTTLYFDASWKIDQIQNGRPSAIIHLDRPDIAEYHKNHSR